MKKFLDIVLAFFDISFKRSVTPQIMGVVYILGWVFSFVCTLMIVARAYSIPGGTGTVVATFSIFIFAFFVMVLRIVLEVLLALFKTASGYTEHTEAPAAARESAAKEVAEATPEQ